MQSSQTARALTFRHDVNKAKVSTIQPRHDQSVMSVCMRLGTKGTLFRDKASKQAYSVWANNFARHGQLRPGQGWQVQIVIQLRPLLSLGLAYEQPVLEAADSGFRDKERTPEHRHVRT